MALWKRPESPYWQIRFEVAGIEVRRSAETADRRAAQEFEKLLRDNLWRQIKLGERRFTWGDAIDHCRREDSDQKSWERTERSIKILSEYVSIDTLLSEITYDSLLTLRSLLEGRTSGGNGWKTSRPWKKSTVNRVLAVLASILTRCASEQWKLLEKAPAVPLFKIGKLDPKWITREQAHALLGRFPDHTRYMMLFALATGLRRANVTGMEWSRVDLVRRVAYVPGYESKSGEPIPVPLNDDAIAVLTAWKARHETAGPRWSEDVHRYVFVFRSRAPITQVTTAMWRRECKAVGLKGVTFHTMRHSWASWQVQAETPLRMLQELGGWASLQMPARYSHLDPGHLVKYAERTLLGPCPPTDSVTVDAAGSEDAAQLIDIGGKGGNRTLDPGIMSAVL
jgi:integrase